MPINFDGAALEQLEREFDLFTDERKNKIDALAAMVFVNLHMCQLAPDNLPQTVPELGRADIARLRMLATTLEAVYGVMNVLFKR